MADMKLGDVTLNVPPTSDNYNKIPRLFGSFSRTIDGSLVATNVVQKWQWNIAFYVDSQLDNLVALMDGSTFVMTDVDGETYNVKITSCGGVSGYPESTLGVIQLTLEEV